MFPIRRFSSFVFRIFLIVILSSLSLFLYVSLRKHFSQNDTRFHSHIHPHHYHHYEQDVDNDKPRLQTFERKAKPMDENLVQHQSTMERRRLLQENESSTAEAIKIADKPIKIYVHFDLKGAAPKLSYFERLFPLLHQWGAHGICIEYEDMFPFDGIVSNVKHKQAYSKADIGKINELAQENNLDVMPLLQTYGHLEFVLKLDEFKDLREHPKYPQVISPCLNQSYPVLFAMIDQYLQMHPKMQLFHIGHDEVYYFLANPACEKFRSLTGIHNQYELFAYHLRIIIKYIREKRPNLRLLIWHDVLQNLDIQMLQKYDLLEFVNPVLWSYREDIAVEGFIVGPQSTMFGQFKSLWGATAFKGATDEVATISSVKHYYDNQVSWIHQLRSFIPSRWQNFNGMILTGWSRYDHFLSLCELLPYSIPSLAFSLAAWKEPFLNQSKTDLESNKQLQKYVQDQLGCSSPLHLNIQEHSSKPLPKCQFPGAPIYQAMVSIPLMWFEVSQAELFVDKFVTDLHMKYNYIHTKRGEECLGRLTPAMTQMKNFITSFRTAMDEVFPPQVAIEWLETYFMKRYRSVARRFDFIQRAVSEQKSWLPRPIPDTDKLELDQK